MKLRFIILCMLTTCYAKAQKQLVVHTTDEFLELGSPICYLNELGDTIIPFGKYMYGGSNTINHIGFVQELHAPGWATINAKGEKLFYTFSYDTAPDHAKEGLFRIINEKGLMGFADTLGNIVIKPQFAFALPFKNDSAKVTSIGKKVVLDPYCDHWSWESDKWFYINKKGKRVK